MRVFVRGRPPLPPAHVQLTFTLTFRRERLNVNVEATFSPFTSTLLGSCPCKYRAMKRQRLLVLAVLVAAYSATTAVAVPAGSI